MKNPPSEGLFGEDSCQIQRKHVENGFLPWEV
jgi:hypothetical protein